MSLSMYSYTALSGPGRCGTGPAGRPGRGPAPAPAADPFARRMPVPHLQAARPEDCGVCSSRLQAVFGRARAEVEQGRVCSCQVAVARHGRLAGAASFGHDPGGRPIDNSCLLGIYSCTKALVAVGLWQLVERGTLSISDRVSDYFPEFGTHGKDNTTILDIVTFTAGLPLPPTAVNVGSGRTAAERAASVRGEYTTMGTAAGRAAYFSAAIPEHPPGAVYEYDRGAPWVVVELIERVTGRDYREYITTEVLAAAGLTDIQFGPASPDNQHRHRFVDSIVTGDEAAPNGPYDVAIPTLNEPEMRAVGVPGGGAWSSASELALFYQPLVNGGRVHGSSSSIVTPATIARATAVSTDPARHFETIGVTGVKLPTLRGWMVEVAGDDTVELPADVEATDGVFGMAAVAEGMGGGGDTPARVLRGCFGVSNGPTCFGHNGAGGQAGWADPSTGISFAFLTNTFSQPRKGRVIELATLANLCALEHDDDHPDDRPTPPSPLKAAPTAGVVSSPRL
eukprot:COSAG05_NODE_463_length_9555_cov_35.796108_6_plen_510_part_00